MVHSSIHFNIKFLAFVKECEVKVVLVHMILSRYRNTCIG